MTVRKRKTRDGGSRLVIDIRYRTADGRTRRFRRDAQVQTKTAALAEERRLLAELGRTGTLDSSGEPEPDEAEQPSYTFADAVRYFRAARMAPLKPSTRFSYEQRLNGLLVPRFGEVPLAELGGEDLGMLDAELARDGLAASSRRNVHIVFRTVLRAAVAGGYLPRMPDLPRLPRVGRKAVRPLHTDDIEATLALAVPTTALAMALAAYAGLRRGDPGPGCPELR
jgi:hypothetical protein